MNDLEFKIRSNTPAPIKEAILHHIAGRIVDVAIDDNHGLLKSGVTKAKFAAAVKAVVEVGAKTIGDVGSAVDSSVDFILD